MKNRYGGRRYSGSDVREMRREEKPQGVPMKEGDMISCMCGAPLIQTTPIAAYYSGARVNCDICGLYCPSHRAIYHCPAEKTNYHPEGYDLCLNCVGYQMRSFQEQQSQPSLPSQQQPQLQPKPQLKQDKTIEKEGEKEPEDNVVVQGKVPEVTKEKVSVETKPVMERRKSADPFEGFQYANEARGIMNMGFTDVEKIKYLLVNKRGDSNQVIAELLSQL